MRFNRVWASSGLAITLIGLTLSVLAQGTTSDPSGGTVAPAPAKEAPAAPGTQTVQNAESEATSIASQIEQARKQSKDVSKAEAEEKLGRAALQAGYKGEAAQHFKNAKEDLGTM